MNALAPNIRLAAERPDFSPAMLRLFLRARITARAEFQEIEMGRARLEVGGEIMEQTGLSWSDIRSAFAGTLIDGGKRTKLWAVLGHFPVDHRLMLNDQGGQALG